MFRIRGLRLLILSVTLAAGCGSVPDVIVDAAKQSAKAEIEQQIDELLADVGDQLDLSMFFPTNWDMDLSATDEPDRGSQR